jgi:hypothetical protein
MNNILNKINQMEHNASEIAEVQLSLHKVELATTINQATQTHNFYIKMLSESNLIVEQLKTKVSGHIQQLEINEKDLNRIKNSLIDLGFNQEASDVDKLLSVKLLDKFNKLYNAIKSL